jgi:hypothetical protein
MELQMYVYFSEYQIYSDKTCKKKRGIFRFRAAQYAKQRFPLPPFILRMVIRRYAREEYCRKRTYFFSIQFIYCCCCFHYPN